MRVVVVTARRDAPHGERDPTSGPARFPDAMPPSRCVPASAPSLIPRARSLVAATALLCVVVLSDAVLPARADPMPREVLESLPDWEEDIGLRRALKCNGASRDRASGGGRVARARFSSASPSIARLRVVSRRFESRR